MANVRKTQAEKVLSPNIIKITATPIPTPELICNEPQASILYKLGNGEYSLVKRNVCNSVWKIFRDILRPDGTKLLGRYYCVGCNEILKSVGAIPSNLRAHKCHFEYLKKQANLSISTTNSTRNSSIAAKNTAPRKRKLGFEMADTECNANSDDDNKKTAPVPVRNQKNDIKKKKPNLNQTIELPKQNSRCAYKRFKWTEDATRVFLQLWAAHIDDLRGNRMKKEVYHEMANEMKKFEITHVEVKAKIVNMSKRYKQESEMSSATGVPSKWEYFYKLRSILTVTASTVKSFEEIVVKQQVSESDNETERAASVEMENEENLMKEENEEEELCNGMMLRDEQQTNLSTGGQHMEEDDDDFEEQHDLDTSASPSHLSPKVNRAERLLQIEMEKLQVEREKLSVMRTFKEDLASFHKDLMELLRRKFNK